MLYVAGGIALALHAAMLAFAIASALLAELRGAVGENRARLHDYFWRVYDVEVPRAQPREEEKVPEPPPPEPEPVPPAPKQAAPPKDDDPYKNLPPPPAKAAEILTRKENPDDPVDLTDRGTVTGDGGVLGGQQSGWGQGDRLTTSPLAALTGVPGGQATAIAPPPPPPPAEDRSRAVGLAGGSTWNCPFPPEADAEQIDQAVVTVQVTVKPDGSALAATVVSDPGHGFGRAARICALARRYTPAQDRAGTPVLSSTPVNVRFSR